MPRNRLTDAAIKALRPSDKQVTYWDANLPGFGLRVAPGGARTWIAQYRAAGRVRRLKLGRYPLTTLADARDKAKAVLGSVAEGADPAAREREAREAKSLSHKAW
jgi:hypothetical protein